MRSLRRRAAILCLAFGLFVGCCTSLAVQAEGDANDDNIIVVLDPGHGGSDPGACRDINGVSYYERDLVLKIANYCKEELEKTEGYTVYITRTDNTSTLMSRKERADFALQRKADALVSFHINATAADITNAVTGALVYKPNGNYNPILGEAGNLLATHILQELVSLGLADNGVQIWNAQENKYPDGSVADYLGINYWSKLKGFPGVLIEHAFINNPNDVSNYLSTEEQLRNLGIADAKGIVNYFNSGHAFRFPDDSVPGIWLVDGTGWWYQYPDGTYPKSAWAKIDDKWYWFNSRGYMTVGWQQIGSTWYYLKSDGTRAEGWQYINGAWYYLGDGGAMVTGWQQVDGEWYYLSGSGAMLKGWQKIGDTWYYLKPSGAMATGWQYIDGAWYYLTEGGGMAVGWQQVDGEWYYLKSSGAMATGWQKLGGYWYYLKSNGAMATGWIALDAWYYLTEGGGMATGWQQIDGEWYYLNPSGAMVADTWIGDYYINKSGVWVP